MLRFAIYRYLEPYLGPSPRRPRINRLKRATGVLLARNLDVLSILWWTDKGPIVHGYTRYYARHLNRLRVRAVLEIGIGGYGDTARGGNSLLMWRSYLPKATIYGLDKFEKQIDEERIVVLQGDQSDPASLERSLADCPTFDLIVDDGSHVAAHMLTSFKTLFPKLSPGGLYAIEDLHVAYDPAFGGGPPGTPGTGIALTKSLVDEVNVGTLPVAAVHVYPGLTLIERAR